LDDAQDEAPASKVAARTNRRESAIMRRDHSVPPPADSRVRAEGFSLFDLWLEPGGLTRSDLEHLFYFGMRAALVTPPETPRAENAQEVVARWEALLANELPRLLEAGIAPYALLGIPGRMRPPRGFEPALHRLASLVGRPRVVGIGPVELVSDDPSEEHALRRHLEVAQELGRPLLARTDPSLRAARRLVAALQQGAADPEQVLILGSGPAALRLVRGCGYWAGLRVGAGHLSPAAAAALVSRHGSEGIALASAAGSGQADLLALPKAAAALVQAGISRQVVRRVVFENAAAFLRVDGGAKS
jgi:predicted metal-dependent TIM-barrel fold hydrolase